MDERPIHSPDLDWVNEQFRDQPPSVSGSSGAVALLVTGCPRSGTTLMLQSLQSSARCAVVDHLAAALWRRPDVGVLLSQHVAALAGPFSPSFHSKYGMTENWREPHEFSYFWRDALDADPHAEDAVRSSTTIDRCQQLIQNAAGASQLPLAMKAFPALWIGDSLTSGADIGVVLMKRDKPSLRRSLIALWERQPEKQWVSLRPHGWEAVMARSLEYKVDFQIDALLHSTDELAARLGDRCMKVDLSSLVAEDDRVVKVDEVLSWAERLSSGSNDA